MSHEDTICWESRSLNVFEHDININSCSTFQRYFNHISVIPPSLCISGTLSPSPSSSLLLSSIFFWGIYHAKLCERASLPPALRSSQREFLSGAQPRLAHLVSHAASRPPSCSALFICSVFSWGFSNRHRSVSLY